MYYETQIRKTIIYLVMHLVRHELVFGSGK